MHIYVSTFISGLKNAVKSFLNEELMGVKILNLYDGLIVYQSDAIVSKILGLRYFNNTFLLIKKYSGLANAHLEQMMASANKMQDIGLKLKGHVPAKNKRQFRIIVSRENQLVPVKRELLSQMEVTISRATGFKVNRAKPDLEFWFLQRSEGVGFFMLRLTKQPSTRKGLNKGELRPELCNIMCRLSQPKPQDTFLDPFCGYGAISFERAKMNPYNLIFMSDTDGDRIKLCRQRLNTMGSKHKRQIILRRDDALNLDRYEDGFFDKIVTDPPWGLYTTTSIDISKFYKQVLAQLNRVLKVNGTLIILSAQREVLDNSLRDSNDLSLSQKFDILVSGKKASIYKAIKIGYI